MGDAIGEIDDRGDVCAKLVWEAGDISTSLSVIIYFHLFSKFSRNFNRVYAKEFYDKYIFF